MFCFNVEQWLIYGIKRWNFSLYIVLVSGASIVKKEGCVRQGHNPLSIYICSFITIYPRECKSLR